MIYCRLAPGRWLWGDFWSLWRWMLQMAEMFPQALHLVHFRNSTWQSARYPGILAQTAEWAIIGLTQLHSLLVSYFNYLFTPVLIFYCFWFLFFQILLLTQFILPCCRQLTFYNTHLTIFLVKIAMLWGEVCWHTCIYFFVVQTRSALLGWSLWCQEKASEWVFSISYRVYLHSTNIVIDITMGSFYFHPCDITDLQLRLTSYPYFLWSRTKLCPQEFWERLY